MIDNSLVLILGLVLGFVSYVCSLRSVKKNIKENFLPSMTYKVDKVAAPNSDFAHKGDFWSVPGTYHSLVTPRSASVQYGSQIQYNMPPTNYLAFDANTPFANDGLLTTESGEAVQPITYDRFMFSNKRSRLREHGDPIRGDLPIVPHNSDWFRPSVQPHIDLKEGAMQVLGGFDNETNNQLSQLMAASAGNAIQTFGGVSFSGDDGLSSNMGAYMRNDSSVSRDPQVDLAAYMSSAPQQSNVARGLEATGMIPSYTRSSTVQVNRTGDVNVMRG
jgi:hypothetical protein